MTDRRALLPLASPALAAALTEYQRLDIEIRRLAELRRVAIVGIVTNWPSADDADGVRFVDQLATRPTEGWYAGKLRIEPYVEGMDWRLPLRDQQIAESTKNRQALYDMANAG